MTTDAPPAPAFPVHVRSVVRALRGSFSAVVVSAGADPHSLPSIAQRLGLNKNLAWKISKIIGADDPATVLQQMPGSAGLTIFLKAAERAAKDQSLVRAARAAIDEYERLIQLHSGDRATLEMMGGELSPNGRLQRDEQHRKLLFQGASYVWGVQARAVVKIAVVGPGDGPGLLDFASLSGLIDFRRIRPDVSWVMAVRWWNNDDGSEMATPAAEALDPRSNGAGAAPLMPDFCSDPMPELRRFDDHGRTCFELVEGPVGNTGALTCVVGTLQRGIPYVRTPENRWGEHIAPCDIPAELLIVDLFVHERFAFAIPPQVALYGNLDGSFPIGDGDRRHPLPLHEPLQDLGVGPLAPATSEVPRYGEMLQTVFDRRGWDPAEFHGFRVRIAYPAFPAALALRYELPEAPC